MFKNGVLIRRFVDGNCVYRSGSEFWSSQTARCAHRVGMNGFVEDSEGVVSWVGRNGLALSTQSASMETFTDYVQFTVLLPTVNRG